VFEMGDKKKDKHEIENKEYKTIILVSDDERITDNKVQLSEAARLIAVMAYHFSKYPRTFTNCTGIDNPIDIAKKHYHDRKIPLKIRRKIGQLNIHEEIYEQWDPNEMILPDLDN